MIYATETCETIGEIGNGITFRRIPGLLLGYMKQYRGLCNECIIKLEQQKRDYKQASSGS